MQRASLAQEVFSLAQNAIKRVIHPNYMRGLVVGSVGELEGLFGDTINAIIARKGSPTDEEVRSMARTSLQAYITDLAEGLPRFSEMPVVKIVNKMNLRQKVDLLLRLLEEDGSQLSLSCRDVIARFSDEVNQHRIEFAHARTQKNIAGIPIFQDRNKKIWGPQEMRGLLLKLREHYDAARHINDYFGS